MASTRHGHRILRAGLTLVLLSFLAGCATGGGIAERYEQERKARAHYKIAMEYLRENRPALAIRELRAAEQIDPDDAWIQVSLADAFRRKGLLDEAEQHLKRALEIKPTMQPAHLNISALYIERERYEEAARHAQILLDDPTFPVPWKALANLGWAQYRLGQSDEARRSLELAMEYNEDFWPALLSLAVVDAEQGRRLEAIERYERVLQLQASPPARAEANYRLAEIYISLGNRSKALQHLTAATNIRPSGVWGKRSQDYLRRLR